MHLCSRLLPRPSVIGPLGNIVHSMANTSQAPDLDDLHREMHSIAEEIRIMNENNARLIEHLAINNLLPPVVAPVPEAKGSRRSRRLGDDKSQSH